MLFCPDPRMEVHEAKFASYALTGNHQSCPGMPKHDKGGRLS